MEPLWHDDPASVGGFELLRRLGGGGMGVVYLARSAGGRVVALKTVRADAVASTEARARFRVEVDAARVMGERRGVGVVDADVAGEYPWLAMEYVVGPSVGQVVESTGPLPPEPAWALGLGLGEALVRLHEVGLVHRDVKPSNVLVSVDGPRLIDFGVARVVGDERLTDAEVAVGTPAFMSPEQAVGEEHGPSGDVFAWAGVVAFAVTGRAPFGRGQAAELVYRVRHGEPDLAGVPEAFVPLLRRCLAKDPAERPSAVDAVAQLRTLVASELPAAARDFADLLPYALYDDIIERATRVWTVEAERRPAPEADSEQTAGTGDRRRLSRRTALLTAGAGALALGGAGWGASSLFGGADEPVASEAPKRRASPSPTGPPKVAWRYPGDLDTRGALHSVGELVAVRTGDGLAALHPADGRLGWQTTEARLVDLLTDGTRLLVLLTKDDGYTVNTVDLDDGRIGGVVCELPEEFNDAMRPEFVALQGQRLALKARMPSSALGVLLVDLDDGSPLSQSDYGTDGPRGATADIQLIDDVLYFSGSPTVAAVRQGEESRVLWDSKLPSSASGQPRNLAGPFAVAGGHLVTGSTELVALRLTDGKVAWRFGADREQPDADADAPAADAVFGPPTADDDTIYVCERGTGLLALDARTGKPRWEEKPAVANDLRFPPVVGEKYVYTVPETEILWAHAVDRRTGRAAWDLQGPGGSGARFSLPHGDRLVMLGGEDTLCAIPVD